jgi:hypothetical protein
MRMCLLFRDACLVFCCFFLAFLSILLVSVTIYGGGNGRGRCDFSIWLWSGKLDSGFSLREREKYYYSELLLNESTPEVVQNNNINKTPSLRTWDEIHIILESSFDGCSAYRELHLLNSLESNLKGCVNFGSSFYMCAFHDIDGHFCFCQRFFILIVVS